MAKENEIFFSGWRDGRRMDAPEHPERGEYMRGYDRGQTFEKIITLKELATSADTIKDILDEIGVQVNGVGSK